MIKKTKHPSNKLERRAIEIKKKLHKGASPVAKLLNEKEILDADRTERRNPNSQRDLDGPVGESLPQDLR